MKSKGVIIYSSFLIIVGIILIFVFKNYNPFYNNIMIENDNGEFISRYEWAQMLGERMGYDSPNEDIVVYKDVSLDNEFYPYVQSLAEWDVLNKDKYFYGDKVAIGKFVAVTAMKSIGESQIEIYLDQNEAPTEEQYIQLAIDNGVITSEQLFNGITYSDAEKIISKLDSIKYDRLWRDNYFEYEFNDKVKDINELIIQEHDIEYSYIVLKEKRSDLSVSDIVTFRDKKTGLLYVREIESIDNEKYHLNPVNPEDAFDNLRVSDINTARFEDILAYYGLDMSDGTPIEASNSFDSYEAINCKEINFPVSVDRFGFSVESDGELIKIDLIGENKEFKLPAIKKKIVPFEAKVTVEDVTAYGRAVIENKKMESFDTNVHFNSKADIKLGKETSGSISSVAEDFIPLGILPIPLEVCEIDLKVGLLISLEGYAQVVITTDEQFGVTYQDGHLKKKCNNSGGEDIVDAAAVGDITTSIRTELIFKIACCNVADAELDIGALLEGRVDSRDNGQRCIDASVYYPIITFSFYNDDELLYWLGFNSILRLDKEWEIVTKDTPGINHKQLLHYEIYPDNTKAFVEECTYKKGETSQLERKEKEKTKKEIKKNALKDYSGYAFFSKNLGNDEVEITVAGNIFVSDEEITEDDIGIIVEATDGDMYELKSVYDLYDGMFGEQYHSWGVGGGSDNQEIATSAYLNSNGYLKIGAEDVNTRECFFLKYDPEQGTMLIDIDSNVEVLSKTNHYVCKVANDANVVLCDNVSMKGKDFNKLSWGDNWEFSEYEGQSICIYNGMYGTVEIENDEIKTFKQMWRE